MLWLIFFLVILHKFKGLAITITKVGGTCLEKNFKSPYHFVETGAKYFMVRNRNSSIVCTSIPG